MDWINQYLATWKRRIKNFSLRDIRRHWRYVFARGKWVILLLIFLMLLQLYRNRLHLVNLQGQVGGKPYYIQYWTRQSTNHQPAIDSLLIGLMQALDPATEHSVLRQFNQYDCRAFYLETPFLYHLLDKSKEVYKATHGAFDPTVAPLVKLWKEHIDQASKPSPSKIAALQEYVGLDYIVVNNQRVKRLKEKVTVDVSGLIQGYAVDTIVNFLQEQGVQHILVKLDKAARACGKHSKKQDWSVNEIWTLQQDSTNYYNIQIFLQDKAVSIASNTNKNLDQTSSLIIDPDTGYPAQHNLLAVIVLAQDGMSADAYATAIMAKGAEFAQELLAKQKDLEGFLIYQDTNHQVAFYTSDGLKMDQDINKQLITLSLVR